MPELQLGNRAIGIGYVPGTNFISYSYTNYHQLFTLLLRSFIQNLNPALLLGYKPKTLYYKRKPFVDFIDKSYSK